MLREHPNNGVARNQKGNLLEGVTDNCVEHRPDGSTTKLLNTLSKGAVEEVLVEGRVSNQRIACLIHSHVGLGKCHLANGAACGDEDCVLGILPTIAITQAILRQGSFGAERVRVCS